MSLFGRALAGAGSAVSDIANKYIDNDLQMQKAQALSDISVRANVSQAGQLDAALRDPGRLAQIRAETTLDANAANASQRSGALATATDKPLNDAIIARTNETTSGTADSIASAAAKKDRALADSKIYDTAPGAKLIRGDGTTVGGNERKTSAEIQGELYADGSKGKSSEDRNRAYEATAKSLGEQIKEKSLAIDKFLADNPQSMTPPVVEKGFFGGDKPPKDNPAYNNYQRLVKERAGIVREQKQLLERWNAEQSSGAPASDAPAPPRRADPAGLMTAGAPGGAVRTKVSAADQSAMDKDAGSILRRELQDTEQRLAKATDPQARERIEGERRALLKEMTAKRVQPAESVPIAQRAAAAAVTQPAAPVAPVVATLPAEVPPPPPEFRQVGVQQMKNPQFEQWLAQYGEAWKRQTADRSTSAQAGADAAKVAFNPYQQSRVR